MPRQTTIGELRPEHLCFFDPLARLLLKISRQNGLIAALVAVVINGTLIIGGGWWISISYIGHKFLPIYDSSELAYLVFQFALVVPLLWAFYVLEPIRTLGVFHELEHNEVIDSNDTKNLNITEFLRSQIKSFNRPISLLLVIFITFSIIILWLIQVYTVPEGNIYPHFGRPWWFINPFYFWGVWVLQIFVNLYMIMWIAIRRFITVIVINRLIDTFGIVPKVLHPDRSNGLAPIGNYVINLSPLLTVIGFWIFFAITYPIFQGQRLNIKYDTIIYVTIYALVIPLILLLSVWKTHLAMKPAKNKSLETVAIQIRTLLASTDPNHLLTLENSLSLRKKQENAEPERILEVMPVIEALEQKYRLLEKEQNIWPFNISSLRGYIISTLSPLFWILVSVFLQKYLFT